MTEQFAKVETRLLGHPKFLGLGMAARGLWLSGLLHAKEQGSGGFVPEAWVEYATSCGETIDPQWITTLESHGLWERTADGWEIHDYDEHQIGSPQELGRRSAAARIAKFGSADPRAEREPSRTVPNGSREPATVVPVNQRELDGDGDGDKTISSSQLSPDEATAVWNEGCGTLPKLRHTPKTGDPARLVGQVCAWFGEDRDAMVRSVRRVSQDEHYQQGRYGFENWARHLSRFDDPGEADHPQDEPVNEHPQEADPEGQARLAALLRRPA